MSTIRFSTAAIAVLICSMGALADQPPQGAPAAPNGTLEGLHGLTGPPPRHGQDNARSALDPRLVQRLSRSEAAVKRAALPTRVF